jgi:hypothetical protein
MELLRSLGNRGFAMSGVVGMDDTGGGGLIDLFICKRDGGSLVFCVGNVGGKLLEIGPQLGPCHLVLHGLRGGDLHTLLGGLDVRHDGDSFRLYYVTNVDYTISGRKMQVFF